jgi:hypothetical protein
MASAVAAFLVGQLSNGDRAQEPQGERRRTTR